MSLVRLDNVTKSFAGEPILEGVSLRIEERDHVGLIGRNGTGKSTIFRIITGEMEPDSGLVDRMRRARFASLAQLHHVDETATIFDIVLHSFDELIQLEKDVTALEERMAGGDDSVLEEYAVKQDEFSIRGGYDFRVRIKQVLHGLGFTQDEFNLHFKALSGGQRTRLMLALVLLKEGDLLLLDEPENHLDLEAREWLEDYLTNCRQAVIIISHDRRMLNTAVDRIVELEHGQLRSYTGNYDSYVKQKELYREQQLATFERQQEFVRKEQAWIDKFRYKATKARQVQSRVKRLEKLDLVDAPMDDAATAGFGLGEITRSGAIMLDARNLSMSYGPLQLYKNVSFQVQRGERVGIIGPNGAGKTTLLRQIAGKHPGQGGEVILGHKVTLGFYEQNHESMNPANDILKEVQAAKPVWSATQIRSFMGRFLFTGDDIFKTIPSLSGGELSRVAMAKLILGGANLLLLDEPTNHLDIASREALETALSEFPGALLIISHDRALIDRLVDKLIIVENGTASVHLGNYTHYRWKQQQEQPQAAQEAARKVREEKEAEDVLRIRRGNGNKSLKKAGAEKAQRNQRKKLEQLEVDIEAMEHLITGYDARFAALDPSDYTTAQKLKEEYDGLKGDLQLLYQEWESLSG